MAKVVDVFKAILTRLIFAGHGFVAIWRVTTIKSDPAYWYLSVSLLVLAFEGIFTLTIKANQEWRWFCPSVFLYLSSVVPSIWLLEFDKLDRRLEAPREGVNTSSVLINGTDEELQAIQTFGVEIKIPVQLTAETWATVIEQFLMLILIIGRWLLPKGELTREQLSQLLLVYIGTAADIIEFFDSFKDDKVAYNRVLCIIILSIWSWSLLQFCMVLTSKTKTKKAKVVVEPQVLTCGRTARKVCCSVDVWSILINILLQDAPFFTFRLLLILHYKIISYMNIFFTCKNTLVIFLQFYRLIVVQAEKRKALKARAEGAVVPKGGAGSHPGQRKRVHSNLEQQIKNVKNTRNVKNVVRPAQKTARSPRRATARLIRNVSEDDGTVYPSPAHSGAYLLCETESPWRNNRGRRRSLSTGDLSATAELSVDIESSPDRSTCFSGEHDAAGMDPEVGEMDSELEGDGLFNVEEDAEENDDVDSQASEDMDEDPEDKEAIASDSKRKTNRYSNVEEQPSCPIPAPRSSLQASGGGRPVPTPRKSGASAGSQYSARSPGGRSANGRASQSQRQSLGVRERDRDRRRTPRQDTGYSTASSSTRESPGNGRRDGLNRSSTPNRERERESRRTAAVRPRELRGLRPSSRASDLQELHEMHELSSPARSSRSSKQSQRPSNRSGRPPSGRQEISIDDETQIAGAQPSSSSVT